MYWLPGFVVFRRYDIAGSVIMYGIPMSYATVTLIPRQPLSQLKLKHTQVTAIWDLFRS